MDEIISRPQKSAPHFSYHQLPTSSVEAANRGHTLETMKSWGRPCIPVACKFAAIMISLDSRPTFFLAFISFAELHLVKSLAAGEQSWCVQARFRQEASNFEGPCLMPSWRHLNLLANKTANSHHGNNIQQHVLRWVQKMAYVGTMEFGWVKETKQLPTSPPDSSQRHTWTHDC